MEIKGICRFGGNLYMKSAGKYNAVKWIGINALALLFLALLYKISGYILDKRGLAFSRYAEYIAVAIGGFLAVMFIVQLFFRLFKYAHRTRSIIARITLSFITIAMIIFLMYAFLKITFMVAFMCHPVGIAEKEAQKMFVYSDGIGNLEYYTYHNILIRDKNLRIYEYFSGRRGDDDSLDTCGVYPEMVFYYDEKGEIERVICYSEDGKEASSDNEDSRVHA